MKCYKDAQGNAREAESGDYPFAKFNKKVTVGFNSSLQIVLSIVLAPVCFLSSTAQDNTSSTFDFWAGIVCRSIYVNIMMMSMRGCCSQSQMVGQGKKQITFWNSVSNLTCGL